MTAEDGAWNQQPLEEGGERPGSPQSGFRFGLPDDVIVPGTLNHGLLQGEILETLKRMSSEQINLVLAQYDTCAREGGIRNKTAYLLGIVNSGPRMGLPHGVVVPGSVKFSLMHGVVLDDLNALPISLINKILCDFENQIREKGNTIQDRYTFMADLIRAHKKDAGIQDKHNRRQQNQFIIEAAKETFQSHQNGEHSSHTSPTVSTTAAPENSGDEMEDTLALLANSLERVNLLTESLAKVTGELVAEKEKRNSMEAIAKSEKVLRGATEERLQTSLGELSSERDQRQKDKQHYEIALKYEQDRRIAAEKEVEKLKGQIEVERKEKKQAEDRLTMLEEVLISERDVRHHEHSVADINLADFDSDCESHD